MMSSFLGGYLDPPSLVITPHFLSPPPGRDMRGYENPKSRTTGCFGRDSSKLIQLVKMKPKIFRKTDFRIPGLVK